MRKLVAVDEAAVVADCEADVLVNAICASHNIGLVRLYRILDRHQVPRRQPNAPKLPKRLRQRILTDHVVGVPHRVDRPSPRGQSRNGVKHCRLGVVRTSFAGSSAATPPSRNAG